MMEDNNKAKLISLVVMAGVLSGCDAGTSTSATTPAEGNLLGKQVKLTKVTQQQLDRLAQTLDVKYDFISNIETDCPDKEGKPVTHCYTAHIRLTPTEDGAISDWTLFYSQVYPAYAAHGETLALEHINGDIHKITPTTDFKGFKAQQTQSIKVWSEAALLSESQLMPNYWLAAKGLNPAVVESTKTSIDPETGLEVQPYIAEFTNLAKQVKSSPADINQYASAEKLFADNQTSVLSDQHLQSAIIPTPNEVTVDKAGKTLDISKGLAINLNGLNAGDIDAAKARLAMLGVEFNGSGVPLTITVAPQSEQVSGSYQLAINEQAIEIHAVDSAGAFYALQSIASVLQLGKTELPLMQVKDAPRYAYRGQHVDVGRNFHSKEMMIRLIKQMAAYKLNKLHLHLAEDEGWRIEIPSFPELTDIGGQRCMSLTDENCLQPQLGSAENAGRDGFYTRADYIEIVKTAARHHIEVIPSLDMPGHSRAAVKAMEARYKKYMVLEDEAKATEYLLTDFEDKTQYSSIQYYKDNTINVCMESSYAFVDKVLDDLIAMHEEAGQPLKIYHIGADETAGAWVESPTCQQLMVELKGIVKDFKHLNGYFIERVSQMIAAKGLAVGGWNDGLGETYQENMPDNVYSYIWGTLPGGAHKQTSEQANRGWNVVLSTPDVFYFDFPYDIDPKERGYHWASRKVNSRTVFDFMPDNLPANAEFRVDTSGKTFAIDDSEQKDEQGNVVHRPLPENFSVTGVQAQVWSETIRSDTQAEYMLYPRMLAFAEKAWHKADWEVPYNPNGFKYDASSGVFTDEMRAKREQQWQDFSTALATKELPKLERAGVFYRLPTVGGKIIDGQLHANILLPGITIEYREKGKGWQIYQEPVTVALPVDVRARTHDGKRAGRSLTINN